MTSAHNSSLYVKVTTIEGSALASFYKIAFHEISVAENPQQLDRLRNTAILQMRREEDSEQEQRKRLTMWTMSRVLTTMLGGGSRSLPPELVVCDRRKGEK
jgi:hypothetical protein